MTSAASLPLQPFSRLPIAKTCHPHQVLQPRPAPKQDFRFIARQPILNREQQVFGYELLFRDGIENFFHAADLEAAARHTLDSTLLMGFDVLCPGQRAFINCTRELLLNDGITLLPSSQTVVEVLESVDRDELAQEAGRWEQAKEFAGQLHISESETGELWWEATKWARQVSGRT
jgi:CBS-domain-containing membrane protein